MTFRYRGFPDSKLLSSLVQERGSLTLNQLFHFLPKETESEHRSQN